MISGGEMKFGIDKAPPLSISIFIWILSSDTICQLNQFNTNSEAAMLSSLGGAWEMVWGCLIVHCTNGHWTYITLLP